MELKKEKLSWIENVANKTKQIDVDLDVIVPDSKPDIKKILQIDADVDATTCKMQNDRILLGGNVYFNIIYMPEETTRMQSIKVMVPFTDVVAVNGVHSEMDSVFEADILSVNYKIINGRKFSVKSVVEAVLKIKNNVRVDVITEVVDENVQMNNSTHNLLVQSANCNKRIDINEKLLLPDSEPAIGEVLKVSANSNECSVKLINNKAIIKGEVKITCTYIDAVKDDICTVNNVTPFTEIFDIDGVKTDDLCSARIKTANCEYNCVENENGEIRKVETKIALDVGIVTMRETKVAIVNDCYAIDKTLEPICTEMKFPQKVSEVDYNDTLKLTMSAKEDEPEIGKIYDAFSKIYIEKASVQQGKLVLDCLVDNYVLYVTTSQETPIFCIKKDEEFSREFDCNNCADVEGDFIAEVLNTSYALNSDNSVELRVNFNINGMMVGHEKKKVITDVKENDKEVTLDTASITVYFVQENDTLWDVAKKYLTTSDAIKAINELEENEIKKGMRLLIPKYKKVIV